MVLARVRQKKMKTIQDDTPAVPERDISVLHMEAKDSELVEQMRENEYDIVSDILEELLGNLWEDIDTADKQSEEEDPCVPQSEIEKDQTYVQQFENMEVEVAAHLQIVVVEDNLQDEVDNTPNNMGLKENPSAAHLEKTFDTSDSSKEEMRQNYLGSNINNFENYNPVSGRLRGGNPAEKVTEIVMEEESSKDEMVSTSNTVGGKETPKAEHVEKADKRLKRPLVMSNLNNNVKNYTSGSRRRRGRGNSQINNVSGRKASRCLSCEP